MDFQVFRERRKGSDYQISGNGFAKSCNVMFSHTKKVTKKLASVEAQFWWSQGGNTRGMHWKPCDKLCIPKDEEGLRFKDLIDFNTSMLGKQF